MNPGTRAVVVLALAGVALAVTSGLQEWYHGADPAAARLAWIDPAVATHRLPPADMVLVAAGEYEIGANPAEGDRNAPLSRVWLDAYFIDRREVTNRQFRQFVAATGHVTKAEREGRAWIYRGGEQDWQSVDGSDWRHPLGPHSSIDGANDFPVVAVSWHDAVAYAEWSGKRLPSEAEWEAAARGGQVKGSGAEVHERPERDGSANVWQGHWPRANTLVDGFFYVSPVGSFDANPLGLYDMIGNVWEWTADWYSPDAYRPGERLDNPSGPTAGSHRVARGGSWFCSANYCSAYRPDFRGKSPPDHAFNNVGFRCARSE